MNRAAFERDALAANRDPYRVGWISRVAPTRLDEERDDLLTGPAAFDAYRETIAARRIVCYRCTE